MCKDCFPYGSSVFVQELEARPRGLLFLTELEDSISGPAPVNVGRTLGVLKCHRMEVSSAPLAVQG